MISPGSASSTERYPSRADWTRAHGYGAALPSRRHPHGNRMLAVLTVAVKGTPEAIVDLCRLGEADRTAVRQAVDAMAVEGFRPVGLE